MSYMTSRMGMGKFMATLILLCSAAVQLCASGMIMLPGPPGKQSLVKPASYALLTFVALQPFMYGQATDADFM